MRPRDPRDVQVTDVLGLVREKPSLLGENAERLAEIVRKNLDLVSLNTKKERRKQDPKHT